MPVRVRRAALREIWSVPTVTRDGNIFTIAVRLPLY
jgi:hypothetical protein